MRVPVGTWRSLVAYLNGVQGVPGSNPGVPTNKILETPKGVKAIPLDLPNEFPEPQLHEGPGFSFVILRHGPGKALVSAAPQSWPGRPEVFVYVRTLPFV